MSPENALETYRQIIERVLREYAQLPYAYGNIQTQTVFDRTGDHYFGLSIRGKKLALTSQGSIPLGGQRLMQNRSVAKESCCTPRLFYAIGVTSGSG